MKIQDAVFAVVDTETTGLDKEKDRLVEISCVVTTSERVLGMWSTPVNPGIPIPAEASAVHGIVDGDVADAPPKSVAIMRLGQFMGSMRAGCLVAHNLEFDEGFLRLEMGGLCTKRLAMHLWPAYASHKNQSLRFRRQLKVETFGIDAHRALGDALVTAALLRNQLASDEFWALGIHEIGYLVDYAESLIRFETWPLGKYRGQPIAAAPADYIKWCLRSMTDLSRDMRYTLEQRLEAA